MQKIGEMEMWIFQWIYDDTKKDKIKNKVTYNMVKVTPTEDKMHDT